MKKQPGSAWTALALLSVLAACSFDYGASPEDFENDPDVIMKDVEYVRMKNSLPVVRIRSKEARRYEAKHAMEMEGFSFEQYNPAPPENSEIPDINVRGTGGSVKIETDSGNLTMAGGVSVDVESEDFSLRTESLSWEDEERLLSAPGEVIVTRSDGTQLSGRNLSADTRRREWRFEGAVSGDIVEEDEEEDEEEDSVSTEVETENTAPEETADGTAGTDEASSVPAEVHRGTEE
ncbi:MAG: LPS export ABC transporter periplasmic protein LptC [Treponema sp.]|jgi:LPS export ABC transporter protein LptC|nr:LPS export ABC transporter periplasmic protein LptC [Treponema sp.]